MKKALIAILIFIFITSAYESSTKNISKLNMEANMNLNSVMDWAKNIWNDLITWLDGIKGVIIKSWKNGGKEAAEALCINKLDDTPENNALICTILVKILGYAFEKMSG